MDRVALSNPAGTGLAGAGDSALSPVPGQENLHNRHGGKLAGKVTGNGIDNVGANDAHKEGTDDPSHASRAQPPAARG